MVSSEGLTGRGSSSKFTHMVFGRIHFLPGNWTETSSRASHNTEADFPESKWVSKHKTECQRWNLILEVISYHFGHMILARGESVSPTHPQGERITYAYEEQESEIAGAHLRDCQSYLPNSPQGRLHASFMFETSAPSTVPGSCKYSVNLVRFSRTLFLYKPHHNEVNW